MEITCVISRLNNSDKLYEREDFGMIYTYVVRYP